MSTIRTLPSHFRARLVPGLRARLTAGLVAGLVAMGVGCATTSPVAVELLATPDDAPLGDGDVSFRWLGVAGFAVRTNEGVIVIDPYLTRASITQIAFGRLVPDEDTLEKAVPTATAVVVGHSHFDHALDAPSIAARTGSTLFGTPTTCALSRRLRPEADCRTAQPGARYLVGGATLSPVQSEHVEAPVIGVPLPGELDGTSTSRQALHAIEMPMGGALAWVIRTNGLTIVHLSSSNLPLSTKTLRAAVPEGADIVLASAAVHTMTPRYAERIVEELRPRVVIPHHFEPFAVPLKAALSESDRADGESFAERIRALGVDARVPEPFQAIVVSDATLPKRQAAAAPR